MDKQQQKRRRDTVSELLPRYYAHVLELCKDADTLVKKALSGKDERPTKR
jgi:hypothetical protein